MKLVKSVALATAALIFGASAAFADGLSVGGFFRTGVDSSVGDDAVAEISQAHAGHVLGLGGERLRLNIDYGTDNAGVTFRYQADNIHLLIDGSEGMLAPGMDATIKYAQAHVKLLDGMLDLEAGKLSDGYTGTDGCNGYALDGVKGARLVVLPVDGVVVTAQFAPQGLAADANDLAVTAAYKSDAADVQLGYALAGNGYYGVTVKAVENLSLVVDGTFDKDFDEIVTDVTAGYTVDSIEAGVHAELLFKEDNNKYGIYPYATIALDDVAAGLSAGLDVGINMGQTAGTDDDTVITVTPSVTYTVGAATVQGYYTYDADAEKSYVGCGIKYAF